MNEFENSLQRFEDMYKQELQPSLFKKTEDMLLKVQWKFLYLERHAFEVWHSETTNHTRANYTQFFHPYRHSYQFKVLLRS